MKAKSEIDKRVTEISRIPPYVVKLVTSSWIEVLRETLVQDGAVQIPMLGTLTVYTAKGTKQILVHNNIRSRVRSAPRVVDVPIKVFVKFRKAEFLKRELRKKYVLPAGEEHEQPKARGRDGEVRGRRKHRR